MQKITISLEKSISELLFANYKCTNCQEPISGVRVQCHVCTDIELCLFCFASGKYSFRYFSRVHIFYISVLSNVLLQALKLDFTKIPTRINSMIPILSRLAKDKKICFCKIIVIFDASLHPDIPSK